MDFDLSPEQIDAAALARQILTDRCTLDRLRAAEAGGPRFDKALWTELGQAGLLGLALPESYGGAGFTVQELCSVVTEVGRAVAPIPLAAHGATALALATFGTDEQKAQWLTAAAEGANVLTAALSEERTSIASTPLTTAQRDGDTWVVTGSKAAVPAGTIADLIVVPASTPDGVVVFLVSPEDAGVTLTAQVVSDGDEVATLDLDQVRLGADRVLGADGAVVATYLAQHLMTTVAAQQFGLCEGALALTAEYAKTRNQFGRPIGSFQAVSQRLADGFIDNLGLRLTVTQAAWRLAEGLPAEEAVAIAKLWAADTGHKIAHTTVHVHGGVGIDLDAPAHRYFVGAKRLELVLGGATEQALVVGRILATEPV
jgi:alkylation response protein AidB-like acyl-CoA dehydrogenase